MLQNLKKNNNTVDTASLPRLAFLRLLKYRKAGENRNRLNNQQGFTLVEVLVAMTLMVIGIFAVIAMQTVGLQSNSIANQLTVATSLASEAIEDISSSSWKSAGSALTNGTITIDAANNDYRTYTYQNTGIITVECTPTFNSPIPGMVRLDVTATYFNKGNQKSVTMTGYKRLV
jgi:type IV pilus assembly protein PilV